MHPDRPLLGISLMIGFCAIVPMADAIAKLLSASVPLIEIMAVRFTAQALLLVPFLLATGRSMAMTPRMVRLVAIRTALFIIGMAAMYLALSYLPLADAVAISFVMPFIMLMLGRYVLGEHVGPHRLTACIVGFGGTLLVIQPSFATVGWPALLPLLVALTLAVYMLVSRQIAKEFDPISLQAVSGIIGAPILILIMLTTAGQEPGMFGMKVPDGREALLLVAVGIIGTVAHVLMTSSLRYAPSATLAPMQYLEIPFATLVGWLVFHDFPNGLALVGIIITMAAGLYIVFRERKLAELVPAEA